MVTNLNAALNRRINIDEYIVWSTVAAVFLFIPIAPSVMLGYLVVILNALFLLVFDKLAIHRNHLIAILSVVGFSVIAARHSDTTATAILVQALGITVLSVYYFSVLTNFRISLSHWMELYMRAAFVVAILGIIGSVMFRVLHIGDGRLKAIYSEPSIYIYLTLPAVSYCINLYVSQRKYGWESAIFVLTYLLADSSLGFLGLLLIGIFTYTPRLRGWQILLGGILISTAVAGLYLASGNFRLRVNDTVMAIARQDISGTNASTFAFLSNLYVSSQSFLAHPMTGVGMGGYAMAYDKYIGGVEEADLNELLSMSLNRDDANSLFLRTAAELGLPGILVLLGFIILCAQVRGSPYQEIRNAILPYFLVRFGRYGAYFSVEVYFFVGIYLLNYLESRRANRLPASVSP